tara:strand:+ start:168 stop:677 length:510 start_codon:yes stop_codon:yes gene_type:complete
MKFPENTVLRINMAWVKSIDYLKSILDKFDKEIFLDLPTGRQKPPNYRYNMKDLANVFSNYPLIKYFAISNVETTSQVVDAYNNIPNKITLVPKIESINGIKNIDSITGALREQQRIVMLDHDDLFSNIISKRETVEYYIELIDNLVNYCKSEGIMLLRTRGVIFSEEI